MRAVTQKTHSI